MKIVIWLIVSVLFCCVLNIWASQDKSANELLLTDALIVDGTGALPFYGEVLVTDGEIVKVGQKNTIDRNNKEVESLTGLVLVPGFVDLHNHSEFAPYEEPKLESQIAQGITTILIGLDGRSPWPIADFLEKVEKAHPSENVAVLVGHGTIRDLVMGEDSARAATEEEVAKMCALLEQGMREGAFGFSTGLEYPPGNRSTTEELISLGKVAAKYDGIYLTHLRDEAAGMPAALDEAIRIGREAKIPIHISHIKRAYPGDWGTAGATLKQFRDAQKEGIDITADCYPYTAWHSGIDALVLSGEFDNREVVEASLKAAGGAERLKITKYTPDPSLRGLTLAEAAARNKRTAAEQYMVMMAQGGADVIGHTMSLKDVDTFLADSAVMVSSDGGTGRDLWSMGIDEFTHPRATGTYPKVLAEYVRERKLLKLEQAIFKMSAQPAARLGLKDRGKIVQGMKADLVAFDYARVRDRSTFEQPLLAPEGIERVWVNGELVWKYKKHSGRQPGIGLRNN